MPAPKYNDADWDTIRTKFEEGITSTAISSQHDVPPNVIRARASSQGWISPTIISKKADELAKGDTTVLDNDRLSDEDKAMIAKIAKSRISYQTDILKIGDKALKKLISSGGLRIKSAHDLEKLHSVMSQMLGLDDKEDKANVTLNVAFASSSPSPIRDVTP